MRDLASPDFDFAEAARFCNAQAAYETTIATCTIGLQRDPANAMLHVYRAVAYDETGRCAQALAELDDALAGARDAATVVKARVTQALVRERLGDPGGALAAAHAAIAADPDDAEAHAVLGTLRAWHGAWPQAWPELECHWLAERLASRRHFPSRPEWNGEDIAGRRLAVVHGQGLGDLIQTARYLPRLRATGAHVILETPPALGDLLAAVPGVDEHRARGTTAPADVDAYVRMTALPRLFGETCAVPAPPYLTADPARAAAHAPLLDGGGGLRAGLVWAGNPAHPNDRRRSIPAAALAPLGAVAGVRWFSLQHGPRGADEVPGVDLVRFAELRDLAETAAIVARLDLVIAVDTAVAHLAGALGTPVWLLLPWRPDWRWSRASTRTPWYASAELWHANEPGWDATIAAVAARLRSVVGGDHRLR